MGCAMASDHPFWASGPRAMRAAGAGQRSYTGLLVHWAGPLSLVRVLSRPVARYHLIGELSQLTLSSLPALSRRNARVRKQLAPW